MPAGSSPLARGLLKNYASLISVFRIIPARAGFTASPLARGIRVGDHPRSRGVYPYDTRPDEIAAGSSPLARGLLGTGPAYPLGSRIIPARAGFTPSTHWVEGTLRDHPRSRGVYVTMQTWPTPPSGSSPLARGLHRHHCDRPPAWRIIPARAGFTPGRPTAEDAARGSSPLARGLPRPPYGGGRSAGIIPARAGFTRSPVCGTGTARDHPRSRGVYSSDGRRLASTAGSSPLARGLLSHRRRTRTSSGIIPARAGFTTLTCNTLPT